MQLIIDCKAAKDLPKGQSAEPATTPQTQPNRQSNGERKRACEQLVPFTEPEFRSFCETHGISESVLGF